MSIPKPAFIWNSNNKNVINCRFIVGMKYMRWIWTHLSRHLSHFDWVHFHFDLSSPAKMEYGSNDEWRKWFPVLVEHASVIVQPLPSHSAVHVHFRPLWCAYDSWPSMHGKPSTDDEIHDGMPNQGKTIKWICIWIFWRKIIAWRRLWCVQKITSSNSMSQEVLIASRSSLYFHFDKSCFCRPFICCCARTFSDLIFLLL